MTNNDIISYDAEGNPIWAMFGAEIVAEDDDEDERPAKRTAAEDDADEDEAGTDDGEQEETVDSLKERLAKMEASLRKANKEAERLRLRQKNGTAKKATGTKKAQEQDDSEAEQWKARAIRSDAKAALLAAGFTGDAKAAARLIRTIDTDELEFDGDDILGLDDAIDGLRETFPALFKGEDDEDEQPKPKTVKRRPRIPVADKGGKTGGRKKTPAELQAEMLFGGR